MKIFITLTALLVLLSVAAGPVKAAEKLVFDSTDNYLGACQLTDKSAWDLKSDLTVTKFEVWYNWNEGETSLPVKLFLNGQNFAEFEAVRGNCDPYQKQWCNADYPINKFFPKGSYTTEIPNARQCKKPNGTGAIRLYVDETSSPPVVPTAVIPTAIVPTTSVRPAACSCNQTTVILTAVASSVVSSILITLLLKKVV